MDPADLSELQKGTTIVSNDRTKKGHNKSIPISIANFVAFEIVWLHNMQGRNGQSSEARYLDLKSFKSWGDKSSCATYTLDTI